SLYPTALRKHSCSLKTSPAGRRNEVLGRHSRRIQLPALWGMPRRVACWPIILIRGGEVPGATGRRLLNSLSTEIHLWRHNSNLLLLSCNCGNQLPSSQRELYFRRPVCLAQV